MSTRPTDKELLSIFFKPMLTVFKWAALVSFLLFYICLALITSIAVGVATFALFGWFIFVLWIAFTVGWLNVLDKLNFFNWLENFLEI